MVSFSIGELKNSWRKLFKNHCEHDNSRLLLKFYAIECGLKAIFMKDKNYKYTDQADCFKKIKHDINKLLLELRTGSTLKLPKTELIELGNNPIRNRTVEVGELNQMWRYGGFPKNNFPDNSDFEKQLDRIHEWIKGVL